MAAFFLGGILIVGLFLLFKDKKKWDNVVIETRGGKIISFSVDAGKGRVVMEKKLKRTKGTTLALNILFAKYF